MDAVAASKRATSSSSGTNSGPKQLVFLDQYENPVQPRQLRLVAKQLKQQEGMRVLLNDLYAGRPGGVEGMCDWSSALSKEEEVSSRIWGFLLFCCTSSNTECGAL